MTRFEELKNMDIDALAEWIDQNGRFDCSPWCDWFNENYCKKCPSEITYITDYSGEYEWQTECECAWCELNDKCRYFPELKEEPSAKDIVKMWLESEVDGKSVNCQD